MIKNKNGRDRGSGEQARTVKMKKNATRMKYTVNNKAPSARTCEAVRRSAEVLGRVPEVRSVSQWFALGIFGPFEL